LNFTKDYIKGTGDYIKANEQKIASYHQVIEQEIASVKKGKKDGEAIIKKQLSDEKKTKLKAKKEELDALKKLLDKDDK